MKVKIILAVIFLGAVSYYAFNEFSPVKPFISKEEIAKTLNVPSQQVQHIYELSEDYYYVPYMKDEVPSMSLWKFEDRHWRKINDIVGNEIMIIELKGGKKYYFWNIKGEDMAQLNLYAILDRYFDATYEENEEISRYYPQIVLTHSVKMEPTLSHGIFEVPEAWQLALTRNIEPEQHIFDFYENPPIFEWEVVNEENDVVETIRPENTFSRNSDDNDSQLHYVSNFQRWEELNTEQE